MDSNYGVQPNHQTSGGNNPSNPKSSEKLSTLPFMYQTELSTMIWNFFLLVTLHPPSIKNPTPHSIYTWIPLSSHLAPLPFQ